MAYIGNSPGVASQRVVTTFTATAGQTTFVPSSGYTLGYCDVFFNGVKLVNGDDYTASNGTSVVLASAAAAGDSVEIVAHFPRGLSDGYLKAEADARYPRVDTASQGLNSTQQSNARANIGAQAALGYTPVNKAGDTMTGRLTIQKSSDDRTIHVETSGGYGAVTFSGGTNTTFFGHSEGTGHFNVNAVAGDACIRGQNGVSIAANAGNNGIRLDSAGRVTMPYQPYAQASSNATSSGLINLNTHTASRGGLSIASNRMTVPAAGAYVIGYHHLGNSGSGACQIEIRVNGSSVPGTATQDTNSANDSFGTQVVRLLGANDYIEFWVIQGVSHGNPHYNSMWAYLLG